MWAQRLQRSKPVIIALVVMMLVFSFQASRPQAVGLDTAVKIVAGSNAQKLVRSIGEKAGMAFTPKSLAATTDYINGQAAKGNQKYIDLAKGINTAAGAGTVSTTKPGWKKYLLDPVLWLTGADLLVEAYDAFNDAQNSGSDIDVYGMDSSGGAFCSYRDNGDGNADIMLTHKESSQVNYGGRYSTAYPIKCEIVQYQVISSTQLTVTFKEFWNGTERSQKAATFSVPDAYKYNSDTSYTRKSSDDDEFDISNVTNADTYRTTIDSDDDYTKVTYDNDIEIYAPDTDTTYNNDYSQPWNTKMPDDEFTLIVQPIQDVDVIVPGDDDDLPTGPRPDPVEVIDRSLLDVARQSYDYLGDSVDIAIASMRDVTDNVTGLITFLDDTFDWLPAEWRALFGSAFILGVFAHFFRR